MKKTAWFPGNIKPVRVGLYQRMYRGHIICYCWWDNGWSVGSYYPDDAAWNRHIASELQGLPWRGLAK